VTTGTVWPCVENEKNSRNHRLHIYIYKLRNSGKRTYAIRRTRKTIFFSSLVTICVYDIGARFILFNVLDHLRDASGEIAAKISRFNNSKVRVREFNTRAIHAQWPFTTPCDTYIPYDVRYIIIIIIIM